MRHQSSSFSTLFSRSFATLFTTALATAAVALGSFTSTPSFACNDLEFPVASATLQVTSATFSFKEAKELKVSLSQNAMKDNTFSLAFWYETGSGDNTNLVYNKVFSSSATSDAYGAKVYQFETHDHSRHPHGDASAMLDPDSTVEPLKEKVLATLTDTTQCRCPKLHAAPWTLTITKIAGARTPSHLTALGKPDAQAP